MFKDFDAETAPQTYDDPPSFRLGGVDFVCAPEIPGGVILDLGAGGASSVRALADMFRAALGDGYETFDKLIHSTKNVIPMERVQALAEWLSGEYTGRPTGGVSSSTSPNQSSGVGLTVVQSPEAVTYVRSQPPVS